MLTGRCRMPRCLIRLPGRLVQREKASKLTPTKVVSAQVGKGGSRSQPAEERFTFKTRISITTE